MKIGEIFKVSPIFENGDYYDCKTNVRARHAYGGGQRKRFF